MKQRRLIKMPPVLVMHIRGDPWKVKCHDRAYFWSSVGLLSYLWCLSNYGSSDVARLIILSIWYSYSWGWSHGQTSRVMGYLLVHSLVCSYRSFAIACPAFLACYAHLFACPLTPELIGRDFSLLKWMHRFYTVSTHCALIQIVHVNILWSFFLLMSLTTDSGLLGFLAN